MKHNLLALIAGIAIVSVTIKVNAQQITLEKFSKSDITLPVEITNAGDERLFVVSQTGRIHILTSDGTVLSTPFLDITDWVPFNQGQHGLLGLAFPHDYKSSGRFYVYYIGVGDSTVISRFYVTPADSNLADKATEQRLITFHQPASDHKAGCMKFGPDGYLYIASGDGGKSTNGINAKDLTKYLGKILRIDVQGTHYSIPSGNPFISNGSALPEIWAYGVRNPWKISFDRLTGDLWIGDVGADLYDEIDFQPAASNGGENYGWPCYEANIEFNNVNCPDPGTMVFPIETYYQPQPSIQVTVTGGFVYRGEQFPYFKGHYIYTEAYTGNAFAVHNVNNTWEQISLGEVDRFVPSFGEDIYGELYASAYNIPGIATGGNNIYKVKLTSPATEIKPLNPEYGESAKGLFLNCTGNCLYVSNITSPVSYKIYDLRGLCRVSGSLSGTKYAIYLGEIPKGIYIIIFYDTDGNVLKKDKIVY